MHVSPRKLVLCVFGVVLTCLSAAFTPALAESAPPPSRNTLRSDPAPAPPSQSAVRGANYVRSSNSGVRRTSWRVQQGDTVPQLRYTPVNQRMPAGQPGETIMTSPQNVEIMQPDIQLSMGEPGVYGDMAGGGCGDCGGCGDGVCDAGGECGWLGIPMCCLPVPCLSARHLSFEVGVHGFRGPYNGTFNNLALDGSFGFHYGANWGMPVPLLAKHGVGFQMGAGLTSSNLSGTFAPDLDQRHQFFATMGMFRRVEWGLQSGFVIDYYHEDWVMMSDMFQLRGELSWVDPCRHEFGFRFATNLQGDEPQVNSVPTLQTGQFTTTDYYTFFYRRRLDQCGGAQASLFAGGTNQSDGLLGADLHLPLNDCWALKTGFSYLIPTEGRSADGVLNESWNVGITLVWYPNGRARVAKGSCFEPLFDVANNGNLFVDLKR